MFGTAAKRHRLIRNSVAVIMKIAYGYEVTSGKDHFIDVAEECSKISGMAMAPGRWLVDYYPICECCPFTQYYMSSKVAFG